jgi:hypothetical protein
MKSNPKKIIIGIIFLAIVLAVGIFYFISQDKVSNKINTNMSLEDADDYVGESVTIIHKDFRAIIKSDWQELEVPPSTYVYLPPNTNEYDVNAEIIYISVTYLGEENNYNLENLLEQGIENSKIIMSDFELTESIDKGSKNLFGKRIKFTGTQDGVKRNNVQFFGMENNSLYAITYSCPINNCNSYTVYNSLVESFEPAKS